MINDNIKPINHILKSYGVLILFSLLVVYFLYVLYLTTGTYSGDCIWHHVISRYSFKYPHLFLDHWGKPVFTLLSSSFSQFGLKGTELFNVLVGLLTAFIIYRIVKEIDSKNAYAVIFFVLFTPLYFRVCFSALTEICFSCLLALSVFSFIKYKYTLGTIILSFLPFARTESILLFPTFIIILSIHREWKKLPLILTGSVIYTIVGSFYYKDILWIINKSPYKPEKSLYGSGPITQFIKELPNDMGWILIVLFCIGMIAILAKFLIKQRPNQGFSKFKFELLLIILGNFVIYFVAHSLLWYFGIFNSLGLTRVIAAVFPLSAIICWYGLEQLLELNFFKRSIVLSAILIVLIIAGIVINNSRKNRIPFKMNGEEEVIYKSKLWLKENNISYDKVFYFHPSVIPAYEINPYDHSKGEEAWNIDKLNPAKSMPPHSIFIWDAHFSPKEGGFPLNNLLQDKQLKVLNEFSPAEQFKVWDKDYKVYVFYKQ